VPLGGATCAGRLRLAVAPPDKKRAPPGVAFLALISCFAVGCMTATNVHGCRADEQPAIVDTLYFGTAMPSGRVSTDDWQKFLAAVITPRFPEGLTAWAAAGQWQNASGELQKEDSYVLHVVHQDEAKHEAAVHEIVDIYKDRFQQEAVLRARTATCISF
jgi:hypothetical protein